MASEPAPMDADLSHAFSRNSSVIKRRSLSIFSRRGTDTPVPRVGSMNMRYGPSSAVGSKRWKSAKNKAESRRSGTILRAVPKAEDPTPAPLSSLEREMATSPNQEILNAIGRTSLASDNHAFPVLPQNCPHSSRTYSVRVSKFSPTWSRRERSSPKSSPDSESTIGVWKDGRVRWEFEPPISLFPNASDAFVELDSRPIRPPTPTTKKNRRPRIQVIIPNDQRNRPLPSLPFFGHSGSTKTAAPDTTSSHEVSPPSGLSHTRVRTSAVSPISTQIAKPVRPFMFSKKLDRIEQEPDRPNSMHKAMPSASSSSEDSQGEDDAHSSNSSKRSSMTSVEGDIEHNPAEAKPVSLHSRADSPAFFISRPESTSFFVSSPVEAGVFDDTAQLESSSDSTVQEVEICLRVPLTQPPQQNHLPSPQLRADKFSQYTTQDIAELPATPVPSQSRRASLIRRRSSSRSVAKKGHKSITRFDTLDHAISRKDLAVNNGSAASAPSPTLSEAENDLERQLLTSITEDNPFKWDDVVSRGHSQGDNIYGPPPALPRKSSKRKSYLPPVASRFSRIPSIHVTSAPRRKSSRREIGRAHV